MDIGPLVRIVEIPKREQHPAQTPRETPVQVPTEVPTTSPVREPVPAGA